MSTHDLPGPHFVAGANRRVRGGKILAFLSLLVLSLALPPAALAQHPRRVAVGIHLGRSNADEQGSWAGGPDLTVPLSGSFAATVEWTRHWRHDRGSGLWSASTVLQLTPRMFPFTLGGGVEFRRQRSPDLPPDLTTAIVGVVGLEIHLGGRCWIMGQFQVSNASPGGALLQPRTSLRLTL